MTIFYLQYILTYLLSHELLGRDVMFLWRKREKGERVGVILDKKNQLQMHSFILLADAVLVLTFPSRSTYRGVSC